MSDDELNDSEVALMCDIAQNAKIVMTLDKEDAMQRLLRERFIARRKNDEEPGSDGWVVTAKGQDRLQDRGVGVNES